MFVTNHFSQMQFGKSALQQEQRIAKVCISFATEVIINGTCLHPAYLNPAALTISHCMQCRYELICGLKHTASLSHTLWSCQMEAYCIALCRLMHCLILLPPSPPPQSVRKDIECCFGILKIRFAILSKPLQYVRTYVFLTLPPPAC